MGNKVLILTTKSALALRPLENLPFVPLEPPRVPGGGTGELPPGELPGGGEPGGSSGAIQTRYGRPPAAVERAISLVWPESQWRNAAELSYLESSWRPDALNNTRDRYGGCNVQYWHPAGLWALSEYSVGLFQINLCAHPQYSAEAMRDPLQNSRVGYSFWQSRGWYPWSYSAKKLGLI